jgi:hypothetical protein
MFRTTTWIACCMGALVLVPAGIACADATWDAVQDFSSTNPSSVWSYGWVSATGGGHGLLDQYVDVLPSDPGKIVKWAQSPVGDPCVLRNHYSTPYDAGWGSLSPNALFMYNGYAGTQWNASVVKFTAPTTGTYSITADMAFFSNYPVASIVKNMTDTGTGTMLAGSQQLGYGGSSGSTLSYSGSLALSAGDTISFVNDNSPQGYSGGLNLTASITLAPEPAAMVCLLTGALSILAYAWRRRK